MMLLLFRIKTIIAEEENQINKKMLPYYQIFYSKVFLSLKIFPKDVLLSGHKGLKGNSDNHKDDNKDINKK